jgi:NAD(P)H dehydrogenase (quinone)
LPGWNIGFLAILKGFVDKVFLPSINFTLDEDGSYSSCVHKRLSIVCVYGGPRRLTFVNGRSAARFFLTRSMH